MVRCMLFVMYGRMIFSRLLAFTERSGIGLYSGIMFANFHVCRMMLFNAMLYMLVMYASPGGPRYLKCLTFNLYVPVVL